MTKFFSCSITGPRPIRFTFGYDEGNSDCIALKVAIGTQIKLLYGYGARCFYSSMTLGVDMWSAEEIIKLKAIYQDIRLICIDPFRERQRFWNFIDQERYHIIVKNSDERICLSDFSIHDKYQERNLYMIEKSDALFAVYDWNHPNIKSGTGRTIRQAQEYKKKIYMLNPVTFETMVSEEKKEKWIGG